MARQARRAADLVPGASLRGLVFDSCYENRIPQTFGMLMHFGMPNRNRVLVSESTNLDTTGLATALRIDESEVLARRYPPRGRGHRDFFGISVLKSRIEDRVRRFSPAAIAEGIHHHPATHELRDLPFSTVGWDMLQEACPCTEDGVVQNWVTVNGSSRCQSCGGSLGEIDAVPVPEALREPLGFIAGLVDPDAAKQTSALEMLPVAIRSVDRTLLYDMVINIARVAGTDAAADPIARTTSLAVACGAVTAWPNGLAAISRSPNCPVGVWDWVRRHYAMLDACGPAADTQISATSRTAGRAPRRPTYAPSGSAGRVRSDLIGAMAASRLGGVDVPALKQAWDDGRFTRHVSGFGSLRVRAFDPAEVVAVAPLLRVSGSRAGAAGLLGLPVYGLEQLLERGLYSPAPPAPGVNQTAAHRAATGQLVRRIEDAASQVCGEVAFAEAMRHVSGRMKPWGAAIAAILDGSLRIILRQADPDLPIVGRVAVDADAIPFLMTLPATCDPAVAIERSERWTQGDALECLNGHVNAPELLEGLAWSGSPKKKRFVPADVLARAARGVTTADIARRFGISIMRTSMILRAAGVPQIATGLWVRDQAELIARRHAEKGRG